MTEETNNPTPAKVKHTIMVSQPTDALLRELAKHKGITTSELDRGVLERYVESNEFREALSTYLELKTGLTD